MYCCRKSEQAKNWVVLQFPPLQRGPNDSFYRGHPHLVNFSVLRSRADCIRPDLSVWETLWTLQSVTV